MINDICIQQIVDIPKVHRLSQNAGIPVLPKIVPFHAGKWFILNQTWSFKINYMRQIMTTNSTLWIYGYSTNIYKHLYILIMFYRPVYFKGTTMPGLSGPLHPVFQPPRSRQGMRQGLEGSEDLGSSHLGNG